MGIEERLMEKCCENRMEYSLSGKKWNEEVK